MEILKILTFRLEKKLKLELETIQQNYNLKVMHIFINSYIFITLVTEFIYSDEQNKHSPHLNGAYHIVGEGREALTHSLTQ